MFRSLNRFCSDYSSRHNLVGPADPDSNLVVFKLRPPRDESEKKLFELQMKIQDFNHKFWREHNKQFQKEKSDYILKKTNNLEHSKLTADELSEFYKEFLDNRYTIHKNYLREWSSLNFKLTWEMFKYKLFYALKRN